MPRLEAYLTQEEESKLVDFLTVKPWKDTKWEVINIAKSIVEKNWEKENTGKDGGADLWRDIQGHYVLLDSLSQYRANAVNIKDSTDYSKNNKKL